MAIGLVFHIVAAVIWIGGMFFAYSVVRPGFGALEPAVRLLVGLNFVRRLSA